MLIKRKLGWEIPESQVTPQAVFLNRRSLIAGLAGAALAGAGMPALADVDPSQGLYPAKLNPAYKDAGRAITDEQYNVNYNNFYEFGTSKGIAAEAEKLRIRPWEIAVDGEVDKPFTIGIDDLLKKVVLEERIYRHRCVEAWSMVVPWSGFPLKSLVELAKPKTDAKYVRFETFNDPEMASGQQPGLFGTMPWPYIEGLTMAEAMHDLAFVVTGAYGKPVAKSMGAPIRIHLPWKYGFKSIKSIVKVSFVKERPIGMWEQLQASEYGFWANVNPAVPHPRWSQASEQVLGTGERIPTQIYNGYGEFVASLYTGLESEKLYM
ncbi:protein-methionine-sulfoxide reductase catalytic subunit MsrP [Taklimakanibacter deserti]|uniref:protein-methionine-sulfoxide reductase catalytic subunit MsrP n=1 Tax=Taklimakanibacter deserti TaxID=2267839 RepID=UPI000E64868C